ncbi:conserved oligomeric Golgi complex subunit 7-like [Dorcoceras hygrometricum]|uniref:Conserved oligomeric Golgi complex subunit 7-like n=1 Tax=Dorcoceras hygrometricum TaxID=472368 RepID=A0A2Z7C0S1_9LAMI|nr:conserved oligomeric Golgi complex subunit 7-like [Dorcoceras hygrometricum]
MVQIVSIQKDHDPSQCNPLIEPIASVDPRSDAPDCIVSLTAWIMSFHNPSDGSDRNFSRFITPLQYITDPMVDIIQPCHCPLIRHCGHIVATSLPSHPVSLEHKFKSSSMLLATMRTCKVRLKAPIATVRRATCAGSGTGTGTDSGTCMGAGGARARRCFAPTRP